MKYVTFIIFINYYFYRSTLCDIVFKDNYNDNYTTPANGTSRDGRNLFNWIQSFGDPQVDPYLEKSNNECLQGDLSECFKAKALSSLDDFFNQDSYVLNGNAKITRMPQEQLRSLYQEPYEFTSESRSGVPEWDQFVQFLTRKVERFLKSTAIEVKFSDDVTENGRYTPRFVDEISSELDMIEDKKASLFSKAKLKKLFIPILILVKLFKLKLLLFLPLILGLASFKKFLGFIAIVIPGLIGFFKLCKPDLHHSYGNFGHSNFYQRPPHQYGSFERPVYVNDYRATEPPNIQYLYENDQNSYRYGKQFKGDKTSSSSSVAFRDDDPQKLAFSAHVQK